MPTYAYACTSCDHRFEAVQSFSDDSLTIVPAVRGSPAQGVQCRRCRLQGLRLLPHRLPQQRLLRHAAGRWPRATPGPRATPPVQDRGPRSSSTTSTATSAGTCTERGLCRLRHRLALACSTPAMAPPRSPGPDHRRSPVASPSTGPAAVAPRSTARGRRAADGRAAASLACMSTPSGTSVSSTSRADIGVIGGSGFYEFLDDAERVRVTTPFGDPSDDLVVGEVEGRRVAFIARHGQGPPLPPAPGQLPGQPLGPARGGRPAGARALRGRLADPRSRARHRRGPRPGRRPHLGPRAHRLRRGRARSCTPASPTPTARAGGPRSLDAAERRRHIRRSPAGTLVVINGPRFSSRAESRWHQQAGLDRRRHDRHARGRRSPASWRCASPRSRS